mmetsp:Transcript_143687/g.275981  ORF Transcript_143687/g.275981 Transcript_143687/m.275981 type:complete len:223 (-) Transcript_143687:193-861(-)
MLPPLPAFFRIYHGSNKILNLSHQAASGATRRTIKDARTKWNVLQNRPVEYGIFPASHQHHQEPHPGGSCLSLHRGSNLRLGKDSAHLESTIQQTVSLISGRQKRQAAHPKGQLQRKLPEKVQCLSWKLRSQMFITAWRHGCSRTKLKNNVKRMLRAVLERCRSPLLPWSCHLKYRKLRQARQCRTFRFALWAALPQAGIRAHRGSHREQVDSPRWRASLGR